MLRVLIDISVRLAARKAINNSKSYRLCRAGAHISEGKERAVVSLETVTDVWVEVCGKRLAVLA